MKSRTAAGFAVLAILLWTTTGLARRAEERTVTTESLFTEMIDLERLTRFPDPAFRTVQFSSFDRRSSIPGGPGWFANSDGFGGEPIPNFEEILVPPDKEGVGEYLVAGIEGPGAVVRLWSAAISGKVRLYLDDPVRPLYEGPAEPFFRRTYDCFPESKGLDRELLDKTVYQRDAAYAPLPFRKSLRIVWIGKLEEIHFYHVGVRLYAPGTDVVSFRPQDLSASAPAITKILAALADPDGKLGQHPGRSTSTFKASLPRLEKREVFSASGPGAVECLTILLAAENPEAALRETILHVVCDDCPWGQVQSPVGAFFGAAPGVNPFVSLPMSVHSDGTMVCRFVMPFKTSLKIFLDNGGTMPVNATGSVSLIPYDWDETSSMHFRARWRADHGLVASNRDVQDLPFLLANGQGLYVGTSSFLMNPSPVPTPYGSWWGEGDEKVFVDEDKVPSTFGTGSEDYFNYSWSVPDIFTFPYCGQPRNDGPGNRGFVTNFRWHILDPLPFSRSLAFYMELYSHERTPGLSYARTAYHYARPGLFDDSRVISPDDIRELELPPWEPAARMGARNTEFADAEVALTNADNTILRGGRIFAGDSSLVWYPKNVGEMKDFKVVIGKAGRKRIHFGFILGEASGSVSALLDGKPALWSGGVAQIDLHSPGRTLIRMFGLEPLDLTAGDHVLTLKYEGSARGVELPEVGVDFIGIQTVDR